MSEDQKEGRNLHETANSVPTQPEIERDPVTAERVDEKPVETQESTPVTEDKASDTAPRDPDEIVESVTTDEENVDNSDGKAEGEETNSDGDDLDPDPDQDQDQVYSDQGDDNSNNNLGGEKENE